MFDGAYYSAVRWQSRTDSKTLRNGGEGVDDSSYQKFKWGIWQSVEPLCVK